MLSFRRSKSGVRRCSKGSHNCRWAHWAPCRCDAMSGMSRATILFLRSRRARPIPSVRTAYTSSKGLRRFSVVPAKSRKTSSPKQPSDSRPMDFTLSDEQKMLRHGAERYLTENYDFEKRKALIERDHGFSESQWRQFAEMGWLALPIPEDCDGLGGGFVDITLMQEL